MLTHLKKGFTIVELLIVVVVIAILASITIVSYGGITEQAKMSSLSSTVNQYMKLLEMYHVENGTFPPGDWACLGQSVSDYPAKDGYAAGACVKGTHNGGFVYPGFSSTVSTALAPYASNLPSPLYDEAPNEFGNTMRGLLYDQHSAHASTATITYYLSGNKSCPIGTKVYFNSTYSSTRCNYVLTKD
ncbi:MAG: type II secretion system protein [Candidatus Microsaccharimonas sp.]